MLIRRMDAHRPEALVDSVVRQSLNNPERESAGVRMIAWIKKFKKSSSLSGQQVAFQIPWASESPKLQGPISLERCSEGEEESQACSLISLKADAHSLAVAFETGSIGIYSYLSQLYPVFSSDDFVSNATCLPFFFYDL